MINYLSLSSRTTTSTIRASKWIYMELFIGEDADLLLGGSKLVKRVDRTRFNSPDYGEGEGNSREIENSKESPKILN